VTLNRTKKSIVLSGVVLLVFLTLFFAGLSSSTISFHFMRVYSVEGGVWIPSRVERFIDMHPFKNKVVDLNGSPALMYQVLIFWLAFEEYTPDELNPRLALLVERLDAVEKP
jgi:hypothetical protein